MTKGSERLTRLSSVTLHTDNGVVCHLYDPKKMNGKISRCMVRGATGILKSV